MLSGNKGKVVAASWLGKAKTMCMMIGMTLAMFSNLPFEMIPINYRPILIQGFMGTMEVPADEAARVDRAVYGAAGFDWCGGVFAALLLVAA